MLGEIGSKLLRVLRSDDQDGHVALCKSIEVLTQLRHVRAAEWSSKAPIEDQQDVLFLFEMGKANQVALIIWQYKVWCWRIDANF